MAIKMSVASNGVTMNAKSGAVNMATPQSVVFKKTKMRLKGLLKEQEQILQYPKEQLKLGLRFSHTVKV